MYSTILCVRTVLVSTITTITNHGLIYIIISTTPHSPFFTLLPQLLIFCTVRLVRYIIGDNSITASAPICPLLRTLVSSCPVLRHPSAGLTIVCSELYCTILYSTVSFILSACTTIFGHLGVVFILTNYQTTLPRALYLASRRSLDDPSYVPTIESQTSSFSFSSSSSSQPHNDPGKGI